METNMAEKNATAELYKQDFASNPKKENLSPGKAEGTADAKADAKLVQDDDDALFEDLRVAEDILNTDRKYSDCESAEDADDEISSDNDEYENILPLNIKRAKTGKEVNQAHLSTNQPEQITETTANKDGILQWANNLAQAQKEPKLSDQILTKDPTKSAKATHEKMHIRNLFHREGLMSKMRGFKQKPKTAGNLEESQEEAIHQVKAAKERGLREEREISARIKGELAEKNVANGGVRGGGMPRIDYGAPCLGTALGASGLTEEERAHAAAGRVEKTDDKTTARAHFEGY